MDRHPLKGGIRVFIVLFFSESVSIVFTILLNANLVGILFIAGPELAIVVKDIGDWKTDLHGCLLWKLRHVEHGCSFLMGVIPDNSLKR